MNGVIGKKRNVLAVWLGLPIITLGVYGLVWWYKINKEAAEFDPSIEVNPALSVAAFIPGGVTIVAPLVSVFNTGKRINQMQRRAGLQPTINPGLGVLLACLYGAHSIYYQGALNKIWAQYGDAPAGVQVPLAV